MKPAPIPSFSEHRNERGVALIIVLGFLGLMVMMAVAFMIQARVERLVADSTLEGMRARQLVQSGIAAALQDYVNDSMEKVKGNLQPAAMFLSGSNHVSGYYNSGDYFDSTNLWNGEAWYWLPETLHPDIKLDKIQDMEWLFVRQGAGRSKILGRYAYVCLNLSGGVDANLLGRALGQDIPDNCKYGAATNRNNVRKMVLNAISTSPSDNLERQRKLADYQAMWQGFDTPVAVAKLTDGEFYDGNDHGGPNSTKTNRWEGLDMDERDVGYVNTGHLSCYSYAADYKGNKILFDRKNIDGIRKNVFFKRLVGAKEEEVIKAIEDYMDPEPYPQGTTYPSVKAVPMFNELLVELQLQQAEGEGGKWQLKMTLKPEFWCPFPSRDNADGRTYTLKAPNVGCGIRQDETPDILVRVAPFTKQDGKVTPNQNVTFNLVAEPPDLEFANKTSWNPYSPGEFAYVYDIVIPSNDGFTPELDKLGIHSVLFQHSLNLFLNGRAVDSTPDSTISIRFSSPDNFLIPNGTTRLVQSIEASDPRLNHLPNDAGSIWEPSEGTLNKTNSNLYPAWTNAAAKMKYGFAPGTNMYCRNGDMLTPVELGYIPIYNGTPWMTLDIFSEDGVELMNSLVCDSDVWNIMKEHDVFYTNGTINPYTRDPAVLCGAFCGIDIREVPNMPGDPDSKTEVITPATAKEISDEFLKDILPDTKEKYSKAGAAGWMRLLRYKGFDFNKLDGKENLFGLYANKNQRIALAHNTWGLFNESDSLFLVFVVAQSISEAPDKVQAEGDWDEKEDMITGERWAVALCWMDTSAFAEDSSQSNQTNKGQTREMDIIMFKYLNE